MKTENFKLMSPEKQANIYGGSWWKSALTALPILADLGISILGAVKSFTSNNGHIKTKSTTTDWKSAGVAGPARAAKAQHVEPIYYVY